jgi:hypothetical protein
VENFSAPLFFEEFACFPLRPTFARAQKPVAPETRLM